MEKRSNWNIDDIVYDLRDKSLWKIVIIITERYSSTIELMDLEVQGVTKSYPLLFMNKHYINLGKNKGGKLLYGAKSKNNTNKLFGKS